MTYRPATRADDEALFRLNHRVFADEIGQHPPTADAQLVDPMHERSVYFVADAPPVVGMISVHADRPYSVERKLSGTGVLDELPRPMLEVRLLAITPTHRHTGTIVGLLRCVYAYSIAGGYRTLLISGIQDQARMYHRIGFRDLGPPVVCGSAAFIPMALILDGTAKSARLWQLADLTSSDPA